MDGSLQSRYYSTCSGRSRCRKPSFAWCGSGFMGLLHCLPGPLTTHHHSRQLWRPPPINLENDAHFALSLFLASSAHHCFPPSALERVKTIHHIPAQCVQPMARLTSACRLCRRYLIWLLDSDRYLVTMPSISRHFQRLRLGAG